MKFNLMGSILIFGCLAGAASADLYGLSSNFPGTVYTIDSGTGAATPLVTVTGANGTSFTDIEFLNGVAYACDVSTSSGWAFGTIDLTTGNFTTLTNQDGSANWFGLATKQSTNQLFTVDFDAGNILKSMTPLGVTTTIGATGVTVRGLTYDSANDTLYATDANSLYWLNQSTGAATLIGSFNGPSGDADLAYDPLTDTLYLNSTGTNSLYSVDKATGNANLIGANNASGAYIDGLGNLTPVPEPATMAALGLGVAALLRRRRRA